jgi:membrane protein YqaA with SNARE-associated domain
MGTISEIAKRWFERLNDSNHLLWLIFGTSFLETIVVPVPIELILIPIMLINRYRIWTIATVTTAGSVTASIVGYGVGMALYESIGVWFIETMGYQSAYASFRIFFANHGFVAILVVGILPIPFQVAMISAGLSAYPISLFVAATFLARGSRYFGLAWLVRRWGDSAMEMWRKHALATSLVASAIVMALYLVSRFLADKVI